MNLVNARSDDGSSSRSAQHERLGRLAYRFVTWRTLWITAILVPLVVVAVLLQRNWPYRYEKIQPQLGQIFASHVSIDHYRCVYFPNPGLVADGLTLRRNSAPDLPPVGSARTLVIEGRWVDLLLLRRRLRLVRVDGLHVVIPAIGSRANKEDFAPGSSADFAGPSMVVEHFDIENAMLDLMRASGSRYSFLIHHILIGNLRMGQAISYDLDMESPQPAGVIRGIGSFGPLSPAHLGATPVSGRFSFAPIDLAQIGGIAGKMSATGSFGGTLAAIDTQAQTDTPDFAVRTGRPTRVSATTHSIINGLNGDIHVQSIDAHTGATTVHASGNIAGSPKSTTLDIIVAKGRAEDILSPFLHGKAPVSGAVSLHSTAYLAPSAPGVKFLERLHMNGRFDIPSERFTSQNAERKLSQFSSRAQGQHGGEDTVAPDAISRLGGDVTIRNGVASTPRLTFGVPGAAVNLRGTFNFRSGDTKLLGDLHMVSDISHVTTGMKSWALKPFAPFFKKHNAGAVIPIAILGTNHKYRIASDLMHQE